MLLINDFLPVPVFRERNQNVLSGRECARHFGLAFLMSYLCDPHKKPKAEMRPLFHTEGCLHFARTPESLKDLKERLWVGLHVFYSGGRGFSYRGEGLPGINNGKRGPGKDTVGTKKNVSTVIFCESAFLLWIMAVLEVYKKQEGWSVFQVREGSWSLRNG